MAFFKYFVNCGVSIQSKWTQLTSSVHNKTVNILFDHFQLKYIHIYTNAVKKRDSNKIFWLRMKILWEPGSQVPCHYPTLLYAFTPLRLRPLNRPCLASDPLRLDTFTPLCLMPLNRPGLAPYTVVNSRH